ncbi:MAG: glycosyltransferase family 2 protein [bacterium]
MNQPLFSIITVTLNPGGGLGRTVDSVKAQIFRDFEHIVKDAGSTDGSVAQYARSGNDYDPIVIIRTDRGIYDAMNQALDYASGKYVLFLNAGDLLYDGEVLEQVAQVVKNEPALGLVYGDYFAETLQLIVKSPKRLSGFFLYRTMLCHQACFFMREEVDKIGRFDNSLRVVADYDLLLRLVLGSGLSFKYLGKSFTSYMGGGFSIYPDNARIGAREVNLLRQRHFRPSERLLYGCMRALTFPHLRIKLMQSTHFLLLQRMYVMATNLWNR